MHEHAPPSRTARQRRLRRARVLLAISELSLAERQVVELLHEQPDDRAALSLLATIKHMRGELTQAIECWGRIHCEPSGGSAHVQICSLIGRAQFAAAESEANRSPLRGATPSPDSSFAELEAAFRLYLSRRPLDARFQCRLVAQSSRQGDLALFKLATLCDAWISEQIGDLEAACLTLERMGADPAFARDLDRVVALAALYERIGSPERLEQAMNIYRFLASTGAAAEANGLLARGYHRLGQHRLAEVHERRQLHAFRRSMERASVREITEVAADQYLPIARLRAGVDEGDDTDSCLPRRGHTPVARAVAAALRGRQAEAHRALAGQQDTVALKYRGDLALLEGRRDEAVSLWLKALSDDASVGRAADRWLLGQLLDLHAEQPIAELAAWLASEPHQAAARRVLEDAISLEPRDPNAWRWLGSLHGLCGRTAEQARCLERALALESAKRRLGRPIGRVLAAAVYRFGGSPKGLTHEVWADREPADDDHGGTLPAEDIHGNLTDEMHANVRNVFLAVREYARAKLPHRTTDIMRYRYAFKVTKDDEPSGGLSGGLPTALAFLSVFLQRDLPQDVAFSGAIVTDSHHAITVGGVGDVEHKVCAAFHRRLRQIVLPGANRVHLESSPFVPRSVAEDLVSWVHTLDEAVEIAFGPDVFVE